MRITITATLAAALLGLSSTLFAAGTLPERGMTQDAVRAKFGAPKRQVAPVGNPPISRWVYDDFTVYFEGSISIHSVSHSKTLVTPPASAAPAAATATVDELPPIEEINTDGAATAAASEPAVAESAVEPAATAPAATENTFRFDPASGRIIEFGPDGKPIQSPTVQPTGKAEEPAPAEAAEEESSPVVAPVVAPAVEQAPAPAEAAPAPKAAPASEPAPAATPAPAGGGRFRFDPATGRIVMEDDVPAEPAAAEPAAAAPAVEEPAPAAPAEPEPAPAAKQPEQKPAEQNKDSGGGGFSIQW